MNNSHTTYDKNTHVENGRKKILEENFKVFIDKLIEFLSDNEKIQWDITIFNEGNLEINIEEVTDSKLKDILATPLYDIPVKDSSFIVHGFENIVRNIDSRKDKWYSLTDEEKNLINIKRTAFIKIFHKGEKITRLPVSYNSEQIHELCSEQFKDNNNKENLKKNKT